MADLGTGLQTPDTKFSSFLSSVGMKSPDVQLKEGEDRLAKAKAERAPFEAEQKATIGKIFANAEELKKMSAPAGPKLQDVPNAPDSKYQDPTQALGSIGSVLALLGSFRTRAPMTAALNAASAAMQGFHQGDMEKVKLEREKWHDNLEAALKQNQIEMDRYTAALKSADFDLQKARPMFEALAAQDRWDQMQIAAVNGDYRAMDDIMKGVNQSREKLVDLYLKDQEKRMQMQISAQRASEARQAHQDAQKVLVTRPDGTLAVADKSQLPTITADEKNVGKFGAKGGLDTGSAMAHEKLKTISPEEDRELRIQAWNYIDKKLLPYRKGSGGGADRNDMVMAMAGKISSELGIPPQELAGKSEQFKADSMSYANLSKKTDIIEGQLSSFHNNLKTWDQLAKGEGLTLGSKESRELSQQLGKINFTGIKTVDDIRLRVEQEFNDPAAVALVTAASAAAFDYARIMSSQGQSAGQITDSARHEAQILVSKAYDNKARAGLMAALDSDTAGQVKGLMDQKEKVYDRLTGRKRSGRDEVAPSAGGLPPGWSVTEH